MRNGWFRESYRHSLAARGISTNKYSNMVKTYPANVSVPSEIKSLASSLESSGATGVYAVGGFVRDKLIGRDPKDIDIEVHGRTIDELKGDLVAAGYEVNEVGKSFGVLKVKVGGEYIDVSVPRTDSSGRKPDVSFLREATPEEAARRRDLTINAIMYDINRAEIVDPFRGVSDLESDSIRAVSPESFSEDPLRVLRAAQFASRFGFKTEPGTVELAKKVDASAMSGERIKDELEKALLKSDRPSVFFDELDRMGQLEKVFPEVARLKGVEQGTIYHPEGDVYAHTMEVLDRAKASGADRKVLLTALLHDTGKFTKTTKDETGRIRALGHEEDSVKFASDVLARLKYDKDTENEVLKLTELHMKPKDVARQGRSELKLVNRMLVDVAGGPSALMARPEFHIARLKHLLEFEKADSPQNAAQFEAIEQAIPPVSHYKSKVDVKTLMDQGLSGPELGEAITVRYRQQINNPVEMEE
jgi:tRNA nucleotidyltransferase (CCA-adding enzyme)